MTKEAQSSDPSPPLPPASSHRLNSLSFPSTPAAAGGGGGSSKHLNPAVRRAVEGGRHHQRSHSIDTKDRTSPILGFGPLQGEIAKFLAAASEPASGLANGSTEASSKQAAASETSSSKDHISSTAASTMTASGSHPPLNGSSGSGSNSQSLQKRISQSGLSSAGSGSGTTSGPTGLARPIPRKASNGSSSSSSSSSSGGEGSPEQQTLLETRRANHRMADKAVGSGGGGGGSGLGVTSKRTASPARGPFPGKPISPRLAPYVNSGHARRIGSELGSASPLCGPQRPPSPIFLPSTSLPTALTSNPDPHHSWDSVWPRSPMSDRSQHIKRLGSPLSSSSSSQSDPAVIATTGDTATTTAGGRPAAVHSSPLAQASDYLSPLLSRSPRAPADLSGGSSRASSPTIGSSRPKARRPHELRGSSSSPTLRVAGFPAGKEEPGSPRGLRALAARPRNIETSKSEPIPWIGFHPVVGTDNGDGSVRSPTDTTSPAAAEGDPLKRSGAASSSGAAVADGEQQPAAMHKPTLSTLTLPAEHSGLSRLSPTSPRSPFLQLSSPPAHAVSHPQDMQLSESPPKTRSFIAMPPRSGYELSDDPDDVGSEEDGSSSGRGSVGTNDEDEDFNDEEEAHDEEGYGSERRRSANNDDDIHLMDEGDDGGDGMGAHAGDRDKHSNGGPLQRLRARVDGAKGDSAAAADGELLARPSLPKRPSLTRLSAVPAPPPVLDPLANAESSARALAAHKGSQGVSLLTYFKDQYEQSDVGTATAVTVTGAGPDGIPMAVEVSMADEGSQVNDVVQPSVLGLDAGLGEAMDESMMGEGSTAGEPVEESLNTLERIFLFAKSDMAYHRVLVASSLPDWIRDVELSDAVEYIIPLLNGLGTDELDVCAAFAPELFRVMWFFFRNCPLADLQDDDDDASEREREQHAYAHAASTAIEDGSKDIATDSSEAPEGTDSDRSQNDGLATRPRISVATFTSLLCALLLNQNSLIAGATQQSVVQFFCRLENRELDVTKEEMSQKTDEEQRARREELHMDSLIAHAVGRDGQPVPHEAYDFDERARQAVRTELLNNVAFAIARLSLGHEHARDSSHQAMEDALYDHDEEAQHHRHLQDADLTQQEGVESESKLESAAAQAAVASRSQQDAYGGGTDGRQPSAARQLENGEGNNAATAGGTDSPTHSPSLALPDSQEGRWEGGHDDQDRDVESGGMGSEQTDEGGAGDLDMLDESQLLESWNGGGSSPFAYGSTPNMSDYKADIDEEAAVGRMASVSLLSALSAEELIAREVLLERTLPEVLALSDDAAFFVRKEVAGALGHMAKGLDHDTVTEKLLPAFDKAMGDRIWHVRLAACFSLPAVLGRLRSPEKRDKTVASLRAFVYDVSRKVRLAALEVIGETIYMFKDDAGGVPDELIRFFIGEPFDGPPQQGEASLSFDHSFGPDAPRDVVGGTASAEGQQDATADAANTADGDDGNDALLASFGFSKGGGGGGDVSLGDSRWETEFGTSDTNTERPLVMAFNLPAVVLTLGGERWPLLRKTYGELTDHALVNVRKSLAASLHEVAKIVGPDASRDDLLAAAERFLGDQEHEVRLAALENIDVFLRCLPKPEAEATLQRLLALWSSDFARDWRLRERLALHIPSMAKQFLLDDEAGNLVSMMHSALADPVSAVRDAGVKCVPELYRTFADNDQVIADGFLGILADLGDSEGYRLRVACLLCIQALVDKGIQRSSCELLLIGRLVQMGSDPVVDVRIALARTIEPMCRRDELYASPQSRSADINGLLARLGRDRSYEVREAVDGILAPSEAARLDATAEDSPVRPPRHLVLGPAEGGPHKPEGLGQQQQQPGQAVAMAESAGLPLFDMDEDNDLEDVDMDDYVDDGDGDGDGDGAGRAASNGDGSFDEDEAPHHLLGVVADVEADRNGEAPGFGSHGPTLQGDAVKLSSPQRPLQAATQAGDRPIDAGRDADADGDGDGDDDGDDDRGREGDGNRNDDEGSQHGSSPSTKAKASDPFLAFVAGRRSQDLSRLNVNFNFDHEPKGLQQRDAASSTVDEAGTVPPTEAALRQFDDAESLRSPGSSEDGSAGRRSAPSSGDWSQLRGDLPAAQQGVPHVGGGGGGDAEAEGTATTDEVGKANAWTATGDGAEEDFVQVDAE